MADLTNKQKMFVAEYLKDLNATEAAIRAGYSPKNAAAIASRLVKKSQVDEAIKAAMAERANRVNLDAQWVLKRLTEISDRCMDAEPVLIREGNKWVESGEWKFDSAGANRATELIGKHLGMFRDKLEVSGADGGPILAVFGMSAEELAAIKDE